MKTCFRTPLSSIMILSFLFRGVFVKSFLFWCVHRKDNNAKRRTVASRRASEYGRNSTEGRPQTCFFPSSNLLRSLLIGMNITNVDLAIEAAGDHGLQLGHKAHLATSTSRNESRKSKDFQTKTDRNMNKKHASLVLHLCLYLFF